MDIRTDIITILKDRKLTAVQIKKELGKYDKQSIQRALYYNMKDVVKFDSGQPPRWSLINKSKREPDIIEEKIVYNSVMAQQNNPIGKQIYDGLVNNIIKAHNIPQTHKPKIIAMDIDNCQSLIPIVNTYLQQDSKSIAHTYYSSGIDSNINLISHILRL